MPRSMQLHKKRNATSTPECQTGVLVVRRAPPAGAVKPLGSIRVSGEGRYAFGRASVACPT